VKLFLRCLAHSLSLARCEVFLEIRSAFLTQPGLLVPADVRAGPFAAAGTLLEIGFGLLDRFLEGAVVCFASYCPLDFVSTIARIRKDASENIAGCPQESAGSAAYRRLESRHVSVAALIAEELELVTPIS
jgi:hypothetical protein